MKRRLALSLLGCAAILMGSAFAQAPQATALDTLFLASGEKRTGKLVGIDQQNFRLQVPLPPPAGASPTAPPMFASVTVPRTDVEHVEFAPDEALRKKLDEATPAQIAAIEALWRQQLPWVGVPKSPAAEIGITYGNLLLKDRSQAQKALDLFKLIESATWSEDVRMLARQGRLRAMIATGNAKGAVEEARAMEKISEDPAVLIEAKYILADATDQSLRKLVEDNPRWQEDIHVIPERSRLYNEALDLYLYPYLFFGSEVDPAARGLWGAVGVYKFTGETQNALECARDLVAIYPGTSYAKQAQDYINSLPESQKTEDHEKDAQKDN